MSEEQQRRNRKWLILGTAGLISGLVMLLIFKSVPIASGTAATVIVAIIALKHLALFVAVSSPAVALFQTLKLKARPYCPWPPEND
jgi:hypothetical protein